MISVDYGFEFNLDTKLSYFLPTLSGDGLMAYALIHYLARIQNDMLEFCSITAE
jgi:hypothetical protein